jgi:N utilization substance protein B
MLSRRLYRIKVLEGLYAWFQGGEPRMEVAEKNLLQSIDKVYDLYFYLLSFLLEVSDFYARRTEDARHKFYPTEEDLNPSMRFLENPVIRMIRENDEVQRQIRRLKINWADEQEMVRKVYLKIRESRDMKSYLENGKSSFREDKEIVYQVFRKAIAKSEALQFCLEEKNIHWSIDFDAVILFVLKTIRMLPEDFPSTSSLIGLFRKEEEDDPAGDRKFITGLFRKVITGSDEYEKMIAGKARNWELDRIALTDIILIKMALAELLHFPTIPIKVTLNEYIEISKSFSSPKSKTFINGLLDKLVEDLKAEDRIRKKGRGLI